MAGLVVAAQIGRFPKEQIQPAAEMAKTKAMDELKAETGVDNNDIIIAFTKHELQTDPAFGEIMQKA